MEDLKRSKKLAFELLIPFYFDIFAIQPKLFCPGYSYGFLFFCQKLFSAISVHKVSTNSKLPSALSGFQLAHLQSKILSGGPYLLQKRL